MPVGRRCQYPGCNAFALVRCDACNGVACDEHTRHWGADCSAGVETTQCWKCATLHRAGAVVYRLDDGVTTMTTPDGTINWARIGRELRESVINAHGGIIPFNDAADFLIDNPEIFGLPESVEIPCDENCELVRAYNWDGPTPATTRKRVDGYSVKPAGADPAIK